MTKKLTFAEAQLAKFGWTEGKGLGKKESNTNLYSSTDGIQRPIAVTTKNDNIGLGKQSNEWGSTWWDHIFNKTTMSIQVDKKDDGSLEIQSKSKKTKVTSSYDGFVSANAAKEKDYSLKITDEELLKACEGRTARKGARIDQVAKVKRVDDGVLGKYIQHAESDTELPVKKRRKTDKKKKKKSKDKNN